MKAYYKINGDKVTQLFLETYDKIANINLELFTELDCIMNGDRVVQPDELKVINGVVLPKTSQEIYQETVPNKKQNLKQDCFQYQWNLCTPTIDPNFFSLLTTAQCLKAINSALDITKCEANIAWCDSLWSDRSYRETLIDNMLEYTNDFSNNGNPPYTFDECRSELN